jgi:hypothetical protein
MAKLDLHEHASIRLVHGNMRVVANLEYSMTDHAFTAVLPSSGVFGPVDDIRFKLTDVMIQRIIYLPDGSIQLDF